METLPIPRTTLTEMVVAYNQAETEIRQAYAMLKTAEERLKTAFQSDRSYAFDLDRREYYDHDPALTMAAIKRAAWSTLVDKMGVRSAMSIKRAAELDEQLTGRPSYHGKPTDPLPEITEANILAMMETTFNQIPAMIEEAVREVYEWLRPHSYQWRPDYKTNLKNEWMLGNRVIKTYCVDSTYTGTFRVRYGRQQNLTALDNVFHMLDGKGLVKTNYGPLTDAISASQDGTGKTDYFSFRCFGNGNLHLAFRRLDLVQKLNAVAGGMRLKNADHAA